MPVLELLAPPATRLNTGRLEVYLVRHAEAEPHGRVAADPERALTAGGARRFRGMLTRLHGLPDGFDLIATSPVHRAKQTAQILLERSLTGSFQEWSELEPGATPEAALARLRANPHLARVLVVGHEPQMSRLLSLLVAGSEDSVRATFDPGAIAYIALDDSKRKTGRLHWFSSP
jgi:phosphohistidine phosphatase